MIFLIFILSGMPVAEAPRVLTWEWDILKSMNKEEGQYKRAWWNLKHTRPKQFFAFLTWCCWATHSTQLTMRSTLCLYSQQLASYHLAVRPCLAPSGCVCVCVGGASGVSFGMSHRETHTQTKIVRECSTGLEVILYIGVTFSSSHGYHLCLD